MIRIRGQEAADWKDLYAIRVAGVESLPYIRPDWVRDELATPREQSWPLVAVSESWDPPRVVARVNIELGWGRRGHSARLTLEQHPEAGDAAAELLQEAVRVAERWWNKGRLETQVRAADLDALNLFGSLGFVLEARLRQSLRVAGTLVDELVLARVSCRNDEALEGEASSPVLFDKRGQKRAPVLVRGGSGEDWEAYHAIWAQPGVYWGLLQIPYPSADWNRERVQNRAPKFFWPLVAEVEGQVAGVSSLSRGEHNRSHVGCLGMMVHQDYQGMGVGSALMEAVLDLSENWLGLTRLQLEVHTDNDRAIALYKKWGFEREGVLQADSFRDGRYVNTMVMSRISKQDGE